MIRSLAAPKQAVGDGEVVRRNLRETNLRKEITKHNSIWIDVVDPSPTEIRWLQEQLDLHEVVVDDLARKDRRPSMLVYSDYIFLSLFEPRTSLKRVAGEEVHCLIGESYFVTVRSGNAEGVDGAYERIANSPNYWKRDVTYFLYLTMQSVIDRYYPLLDAISLQLNQLEESLLSDTPVPDAQRQIYLLKQQLFTLRQMIAPQREVVSNAIGEERLNRTKDNRDLFQHLYERLLRIYDLIDSQRDLSSNVLDLLQNRSSAKLTETVNRLTIFSMIFLPLTVIIGLFELNFVTAETEFRIPISGLSMFVIVLAMMFAIVLTMLYFFRKREWI